MTSTTEEARRVYVDELLQEEVDLQELEKACRDAKLPHPTSVYQKIKLRAHKDSGGSFPVHLADIPIPPNKVVLYMYEEYIASDGKLAKGVGERIAEALSTYLTSVSIL